MNANDNAAALAPVVTDLRELVNAMAKDDRVPVHYFYRMDELTEELAARVEAARRIS